MLKNLSTSYKPLKLKKFSNPKKARATPPELEAAPPRSLIIRPHSHNFLRSLNTAFAHKCQTSTRGVRVMEEMQKLKWHLLNLMLISELYAKDARGSFLNCFLVFTPSFSPCFTSMSPPWTLWCSTQSVLRYAYISTLNIYICLYVCVRPFVCCACVYIILFTVDLTKNCKWRMTREC